MAIVLHWLLHKQSNLYSICTMCEIELHEHISCISFRFEGSIFFAYDRHFLQREEDRLEDAIIYFYPHSVSIVSCNVVFDIEF
jgi:hypothetical protein